MWLISSKNLLAAQNCSPESEVLLLIDENVRENSNIVGKTLLVEELDVLIAEDDAVPVINHLGTKTVGWERTNTMKEWKQPNKLRSINEVSDKIYKLHHRLDWKT